MVIEKNYSKIWFTTRGYPLIQIFQQKFVHLFCTVFEFTVSFCWYSPYHVMVGTLPSNHVSMKLMKKFSSASNCQDELGTGRIGNTECWKRIFITVFIGPEYVVDVFSGTVVYGNLRFLTSLCPYKFAKGDLEEVLKWGMKLNLIKQSDSPICVFPTRFRPTTFINDPHYKTTEAHRPTSEKIATILTYTKDRMNIVKTKASDMPKKGWL